MARSAASMCLSEVVSHFEELDDPRSTINRLHPLLGVLTISLMGVLAGADGPTGIHTTSAWMFVGKIAAARRR
ncbi:MAG: transposase family protein, partial [Planctomycetia bacterium]